MALLEGAWLRAGTNISEWSHKRVKEKNLQQKVAEKSNGVSEE